MDEETQKLYVEYISAMKSVQCAVGFEIETGRSTDSSPKQLRTGVNSAMVEHGALVKLLVDKGLFTQKEFITALRDMALLEKKSYEDKYPGVKFY